MQGIQQNKIKERVPAQLKKQNLQVNKTKTEEYTIKRNGQTDWKRCKYLGYLLVTEEDIKRRKALGVVTYNKLKNILGNKSTSMKTKIRILKLYIESVFLYHSELWTLTKLLAKKMIKKIFQIPWHDKITNVEKIKNKINLYSTLRNWQRPLLGCFTVKIGVFLGMT